MRAQRQPIDNSRYAGSGIPIILRLRHAGGWVDGLPDDVREGLSGVE